MNFEIRYHEFVKKYDIPRLSQKLKRQIQKAIEEKLGTHPEQFGKPLRRSLKGYRRLRVGDHRVIFRIDGNVVKIFIIQPRSVVYQNVNRRIFN